MRAIIKWGWRNDRRRLGGLVRRFRTVLGGALLAHWLGSYFFPLLPVEYPLVIGYGAHGSRPGKAFWLSLVFAAGAAVTFTILGSPRLMGRLLGWRSGGGNTLGLLMVLMALQVWGFFSLSLTYLTAKNKRRGCRRVYRRHSRRLFSSPCATPVLVALLAVVAGKGSWPGGFAPTRTPWATYADGNCRDFPRIGAKLSRSRLCPAQPGVKSRHGRSHPPAWVLLVYLAFETRPCAILDCKLCMESRIK